MCEYCNSFTKSCNAIRQYDADLCFVKLFN